ncbi:MAG: sensor histidine kinase [Limisphaerales bacterium]
MSLRPVYLALLLLWVLVVGWQAAEHQRVAAAARDALINRSKDISSTVSVVLRSQRHFNLISQERLESALAALIKSNELTSVVLLNARGEAVAAAGAPLDPDDLILVPAGIQWDEGFVTLMNLVDLGTNVTADLEGGRPPIVFSRTDIPPPPTNRPPPGSRPNEPGRAENGPPPPDRLTDSATDNDRPPRDRDRDRDRRPRFGRPFWMSEAEYQAALEKRGIHSFVMVLSTEGMTATIRRDLWVRIVICAFAGVAACGFALAWRNRERNAELEIRLARAAELNARLREMNLAAAGLAHETRNPLNIIRGLAQLISRHEAAPADVRERATQIVNESDRVTAQLNEFINYSRPREVRRAAVALNAIFTDLARALASDLEDKGITLHVPADLPVIEADEQLLRQALFNLLLNAIQAGDKNGEIRVVADREVVNGATEWRLDVRDNGPGVPAEQRGEIFKPYFTTHPDGTGLGLAVVQQIATAHGWDVECLPNEPRGAIFRLRHLRPAG